MKKLVVTIICLLALFDLVGQEPKNEFLFQTKSTRSTITRGNTNNLDLRIVRSKRYAESAMKLTVGSALPAGIEVSFQPMDGTTNTATAIIAASPLATSGSYSLVLNCTINNKTKGIIVKLIVLE
jgi:hypothetical protein